MTKEDNIRAVLEAHFPGFREDIIESAVKMIMGVTKGRHGRWEWNKRLCEWYCSNCDRIMTPYIVEKSEGEYEMTQPNYCGWCGAKMDLGGDTE